MTGRLLEGVKERTAAEHQVRELLRRLVFIQENERRQIARELHDQLGQQMPALRLKLESVGTGGGGGGELLERVGQAQALAAEIDSAVDFLAWEMRPASLDEIGVEAALRNFVWEWAKQYGVEAVFHSSGFDDERLQPEVETNLYRILQEALQNVHKHAGADRVDVLLERGDGEAVLIVEDNGHGYDEEQEVALDSDKGMGVINMRERATLVGGRLEIESTPGGGTTIFVRVPFRAEPPRPPDGEEPRP
jgi:signal transduction histidine kinase